MSDEVELERVGSRGGPDLAVAGTAFPRLLVDRVRGAASTHDGAGMELGEFGELLHPVAESKIVVVEESHVATRRLRYSDRERVSPAPAFHADRPGPLHKPTREALHHLDHRRVVAVSGVVTADDDLDVAVGLGSERGEVVLKGDEAPALSAHDHAQERHRGGLARSL